MPCWYYDKSEIRNSPSSKDGISFETECRYRLEGARFIQDIGAKMCLGSDTYASGVVFFHRFYMFHSFKDFHRYVTAACCLFLAGKVEETPKKCRDIIKVAKTILTEQEFSVFGEDAREEVMTLERVLLQTIKFDLMVEHPYVYLRKFAKSLKSDGNKEKSQKLMQMAWTFINDSMRTTLCLQWEPDIIAAAALYLSSRMGKFEVQDWHPDAKNSRVKWWEFIVPDITLELLEDVCHNMLDLYSDTQTAGGSVGSTHTESPPPPPPPRPGKHMGAMPKGMKGVSPGDVKQKPGTPSQIGHMQRASKQTISPLARQDKNHPSKQPKISPGKKRKPAQNPPVVHPKQTKLPAEEAAPVTAGEPAHAKAFSSYPGSSSSSSLYNPSYEISSSHVTTAQAPPPAVIPPVSASEPVQFGGAFPSSQGHFQGAPPAPPSQSQSYSNYPPPSYQPSAPPFPPKQPAYRQQQSNVMGQQQAYNPSGGYSQTNFPGHRHLGNQQQQQQNYPNQQYSGHAGNQNYAGPGYEQYPNQSHSHHMNRQPMHNAPSQQYGSGGNYPSSRSSARYMGNAPFQRFKNHHPPGNKPGPRMPGHNMRR